MRTSSHEVAPASALAAAVAAARARLGMSEEQLARELGVSRLTLHEIELGRDSRASTLAKILAVLKDVLPTDVLGCVGRPAVGVSAAWRFDVELHGSSAQGATREVRLTRGGVATRWAVEGVRVRATDLASPQRLADLLRLVVSGGSAVLARLPAVAEELLERGKAAPFEESGSTHAVTLRGVRSPVLSYERRDAARSIDLDGLDPSSAAGCLALGSIAVVGMPTRQVKLSLEPPEPMAGTDPVALAWLSPLVPEAGEPGLGNSLGASRAVARREGRRHVLVVPRPPVGLVIGLGFRAQAKPALRSVSRARSRVASGTAGALAATLRRAREAEGISVRELARRMSVGPMTVSDLERGRDARLSTLHAMLEALPDLSPWDLLAPAELSSAQGWGYRRDLFGCEVESESKIVEITEEGDARMRIETRGLRLLAPRPGPLRLRMGFSVPTVVPTRARLSGVAVPGDRAGELRISAAQGQDGERLHQLTIPEKLARRGISCTRELMHRAVYALTAERGRKRHGIEGPFHEGASFAAVLPVRVLRLIVRFPRGAWPCDVTSHAWPMSQAPDPAAEGIASWLHPEGLGLEADARRRELSLRVERPIIGAKYGIGWRLR